MIEWNLIHKLMKCFPGSYINEEVEFIAHATTNQYLCLRDCENEMDVKCKVLEWLSRAAHKTCPYGSDRRNREFHRFMRNGINSFLGTNFTKNDMDLIYTYLGNEVNHKLTIKFIESGYNLEILQER